ncbi:MAG: transposase [Actinomycetota bacterium]|nr:transposase [Actinomycetota bacterium]
MSQVLWLWTFYRIGTGKTDRTLDLDSSVFTRYGSKEGAKKGYNPKKPGRPSHRPIFAILSGAKIVANLWLRSGEISCLTKIDHFMDETLAKLPSCIEITHVRADSGFHARKALSYFEGKGLKYAVYVRMDPRIQRAIASIGKWSPIDDPNREIADISYRALKWKKHRRGGSGKRAV